MGESYPQIAGVFPSAAGSLSVFRDAHSKLLLMAQSKLFLSHKQCIQIDEIR